MKKILFCHTFFLLAMMAAAQGGSYTDSMKAYQEKYVKEHGAVKGKDRDYLHFFPINEKYRVNARFERVYSFNWFEMETSGKRKQTYRIYGVLHFKLGDSTLKLQVYQSKDLMSTKAYGDYLFVPFTDRTCGDESYENGRYLELRFADVTTGNCVLDFNKAYNPYCAYVSNVYNCPIPPKENDLPVAVRSGEMKYGKSH
ncbi:MAG: DUF1684 domain-containing protein [Chitinophagaceae bacterium]|nr:DUF1684 domain-containing protein [Chitinophagaceae bacterium]